MASKRTQKPTHHSLHQVNYEIEWTNFRGFQTTNTVVFRPLTVLLGRNNVGKTSLTAPLLLLSQTMTSQDAITPLVTKGRLIDYGIFRNNIYFQDAARNIELTLRHHVHDAGNIPLKKIGKIGSYPPGALKIVLGLADDKEEVLLREFHLYDIFKRPYISRIRQDDGSYTLTGIPQKSLKEQELKAIQSSRPTNFMFTPNHILYCYRRESENRDDEASTQRSRSLSPDFSHYLQITAYSFERIRNFLAGTTYIGPLRDRPRRHYEVESEAPRSVGPHGENTANLLRRSVKNQDFKAKLDKWIQNFEFGDSICIDVETDDIFSISFKRSNSDRKINIADSGFGASQVLPLIVQALAAKDETLTIAEQPEIHLNPRLQTMLADLFVEMANSGRRVVVETHSEHLLLRLRRLIAEGVIKSDKVSVYFVDTGETGSSVTPIHVDETGHIPKEEWPKGFFAETLQESLALASAQTNPKPARRTKQSPDGVQKRAR